MRASSALWAALAIAVSLFAAPLRAQFAYVANSSDSTVSGFKIDSSTGALTPITGSPFTAGLTPFSVAVDPSVKFVYVANQSSGDVSGYTIDSTTGALTQITGSNPSPFTVAPNGSGPISVAVDPSGKFVYVANNFSNNVSGFTIDPGTGALMPIAGSPFSDPALFNPQPASVAVDPSGKFVYVTNAGTNSVSGFSIASNGVLTLLGNFPLGSPATNPRSVAVDPSGKFVYVANLGSNTVSGFTIDPGTGALTLIGSPFTVPGGGKQPRSVAVDPSGKFVYVVNQGSGNVSGFTITPGTGVLMPFTGSPFTAGLFPHSVAVGGKFAYVTNQGGGAPGTVSGFMIDSTTGALTEIPPINQPGGSPFPTGLGPEGVAVALVPCPAPVITGATASPHVLFPPNHKFVDVTIDYTETSNCSSTCTLSVTSNEPGPNEWIIVDEHHVRLLAERNGNGRGRVYTITITCTNEGGTTTQDVTVLVPHG